MTSKHRTAELLNMCNKHGTGLHFILMISGVAYDRRIDFTKDIEKEDILEDIVI